MVKTPWFDYEIPFSQAAELGTQKVITDHATIGIVVTCDGSFGEIPRENYIEPEERTVAEFKEAGEAFYHSAEFRKTIQRGCADSGGADGRKIRSFRSAGEL